ncbi:PREDICTED: uncharacterized protein LOC105455065 [Wasmannia auropunctata]|uniref:uncharacterized protein LOC105455065 n=1 Tax=Wasmannia auropunctata TaxID=64793 RepID=UPI0005EEB583|nr:PREDICTED: uncharacterized protein LOC105455065 [Wasmannia auropunctata]
MIMWRSSKRLIINCIQFVIRCGRSNFDADDLDDISDYDVLDVPMHFQPQTFGLPRQPRQDDLQHRPDAPGARRTSPPEVVTKVLRALEEMGEPVGSPSSTMDKMRGASSKPLGCLPHSATPSTRTS